MQQHFSAYAAGATVGSTALAAAIVEPVLLPVLGVPLSYLLAACAGALIGLGHAKPGTWAPFLSLPAGTRAKRLGWVIVRASGLGLTVAVIAVISAWCVVVAPHVPLLTWTGKIPPLPFAGLLAASGQYLFPRLLTAAGRYVERRSEGGK